ncbi:MAG: exo-alpha-sialidase [Armatimonadetes bacterium]|nr:exo-alpha-sialidase [Armatimonadota bacterium]
MDTVSTLASCVLTLTSPVLVDKAPGHFWFPTLHVAGTKWLVCEVVKTGDMAQGKWPAVLYVSADGGRTWRKGAETDSYGPASFSPAEGKLLIMPYEMWPLEPGDKRRARADGTRVSIADDGTVTTAAQPMQFLDFPRDLGPYNKDELCMLTNGNLLRRRDGSLIATMYGTYEGEKKYVNLALTGNDDGATWRYLGTVGTWQDTPGEPEGPCESSNVRLADGRLMCVYRVGSGRGHVYWRSYSADDGVTWTKPAAMPGVWSVEPQLVRLENGLILLSGGREGLFLWVCADGEGKQWEPVNLAEHHNRTLAGTALHLDPDYVSAKSNGDPAASTSYTGMVQVGPNEVAVVYDRLANGWSGAPGPRGAEDAVFCVRVSAKR